MRLFQDKVFWSRNLQQDMNSYMQKLKSPLNQMHNLTRYSKKPENSKLSILLQNTFKTARLEPNVDESKLQKILDKMAEMNFKIIDLKKQCNEARFSPDMQNKLRSLGK